MRGSARNPTSANIGGADSTTTTTPKIAKLRRPINKGEGKSKNTKSKNRSQTQERKSDLGQVRGGQVGGEHLATQIMSW